ncbi:MAG: hypothetical protein Q8N82_03895 [Deltaproteobacteria bacterium]|nr:hypothetical protein [Deltaproteobacteria bacterium]
MSLEELKAEAMKLNHEARAKLAHALLESLEDRTSDTGTLLKNITFRFQLFE